MYIILELRALTPNKEKRIESSCRKEVEEKKRNRQSEKGKQSDTSVRNSTMLQFTYIP